MSDAPGVSLSTADESRAPAADRDLDRPGVGAPGVAASNLSTTGGSASPAGSILLTVIGAAYTVLAVAALARSGYQALTGTATAGRAGTAVALSGIAGAIYLVAAIGLRRGTPRSLQISRWCCAVEQVGVIVVSLIEIGVGGFDRAAVWSGFGIGYGYVPLLLPVLAYG